MTTFIDGPAKWQTLTLSRAPYFLRAVVAGGKWDALDQIGDKPADREMVFVYELASTPSTAFMDGTGPDGRRRGWVATVASYRFRTDQPPDAVLRDTDKWQKWCAENAPE